MYTFILSLSPHNIFIHFQVGNGLGMGNITEYILLCFLVVLIVFLFLKKNMTCDHHIFAAEWK